MALIDRIVPRLAALCVIVLGGLYLHGSCTVKSSRPTHATESESP